MSHTTLAAWAESLRFYPGQWKEPEQAERPGQRQAKPKKAQEQIWSYSGSTHSRYNKPKMHLESDVRVRAGVAHADPAWTPEQLPQTWAPNMVSSSMKRKLERTVHGLLTKHHSPGSMANLTPHTASNQPTKARGSSKAGGRTKSAEVRL